MLMWPQGKVCVLLTPDHKVPWVVWKGSLTHLVSCVMVLIPSGRGMMWTSSRYQEAYLPRIGGIYWINRWFFFLIIKVINTQVIGHILAARTWIVRSSENHFDYQNRELAWVSGGFDHGVQHAKDSWLRLHTVDSITAVDRCEWRVLQKEAPNVRNRRLKQFMTLRLGVFLSA